MQAYTNQAARLSQVDFPKSGCQKAGENGGTRLRPRKPVWRVRSSMEPAQSSPMLKVVARKLRVGMQAWRMCEKPDRARPLPGRPLRRTRWSATNAMHDWLQARRWLRCVHDSLGHGGAMRGTVKSIDKPRVLESETAVI